MSTVRVCRQWTGVVVFCCFWGLCTQLRAASGIDRWTNSASGLWRDGSNWSSNRPPDTSFTQITFTNSTSKTVTIDALTPVANLSVPRVTVSAPSGSVNTLALINVGTNQPLQLYNTLTIDRGGIVYVTNSAINIDGTSGGILNTLGGTLTIESGAVDCSSTTAAKVGTSSGAFGTVNLNGGSMQVFQIQLGAASGAAGALNLSNGVFQSTSLITLGQAFSSTGAVYLVGGQLIATNDLTKVGNLGVGQLTISGGEAQFAFLSTGENSGSAGSIELSGGTLQVIPRTTNDWLRIGSIGYGRLAVSAGTHHIGSEFHVADDLNATGEVSVTGGQLIVTNDITAIGRYGNGSLTIANGGLVQLTNSSIGRHDGSVGFLSVLTNGTLWQVDDMSIGRFANATGHVLLDGGTMQLTNDNVWVGREGTGDLTISNGLLSARSIWVGMSPDGTNVPVGALYVYGGTTLLSSNVIVGTAGVSTGQVQILGGSTLVSGSSDSRVDVQSGVLDLSGGSLQADKLVVTNPSGLMTFSSGLLQAREMTVSNGTAFVIGDGVNPATLELLGGVCVFSDGLVISSNATVRGCGTIVGNIVNNGVLSTNCGGAPVITRTVKSGAAVSVFFTTVTGSTNLLQYKDALGDPDWTSILPAVQGTGTEMSQVDTNAVVPTRFYRILVP